MEGPIKQLYEKDGAEFKPISVCDCEGGGSGSGGGGGSLPDNISAVATAFEASTVSATANVDQETGVFSFKFGLKPGPKGDKGDKGDSGETPIAHKTVMAFKTSIETPSTPVGGHWDITNDVIIYPSGWSPTDGIAKPIWMSTGEFSSVAPNNPTWSKPIKISGDDGANGTDGVTTEFIYKLTETSLVAPDKPESVNQTEFIPTGWTDSPSGISEEMQCEWVCSRKKDASGNWGDWDGPVIWAKWGANGQDGDGVEYIYKVNNGEVLENPTPTDYATNTDYQDKDKEYVPSEWTDNPTGVSASNTHEWVCARKFRNGKWQAFSNPALWAKFGEQGDNGINIRTMYAKTEGSDEPPVFVQDNINPGSIWGLAIPFYESPEAIWSITAYVTYDNKLAEVETIDDEGNTITVYGWQGPILVSGLVGKNGTPVNYKTYVYKLSDVKPDKPTSNDPKNPGDGWVDYPNTTGQWWQCIGTVNGVTELVTEWSEVLPVNGQDGIAQDGKKVEFRFAVNNSQTEAPAINKAVRQPSGWTTQPPAKEESQFMWMTVATINPDDTLAVNWSDPVCISGERGPQGYDGPVGPPGPIGPSGISGIPGKDIEARYCLGTEDSYIATYNSSVANANDPTSYGWSKTVPSVTNKYPYIWCIQTSFVYDRTDENAESYIRNLEHPWSAPFRLSGINGLDGAPGADGKKGQVIYPAGIYDPSITYVTDDNKAPYVYYPSTGKFYVLNTKMSWIGTSQSSNPSNSSAWVEFDNFEAIYAKIGIISNGLIGSAVFNGKWMFSQQGITTSGKATSDYENFNPSDPYKKSNSFRPNWCVDLETGAQWLDAGNIIFYADKYNKFNSAKLGNWYITKDGALTGDVDDTGYKVLNFDPDLGLQITGTQGNKVLIRSNGSGYLASGNIEWNTDGTEVIFGGSDDWLSNKINLTESGITISHANPTVARGFMTTKLTNESIIIEDSRVGGGIKINPGGVFTRISGSDEWVSITEQSSNIQFVSSLPNNADANDNTLYVLI